MKKFIIFAAAALALAACSNEVEENLDDTQVAAQISAGVSTRADNDKWEADEIGVMVTGGNTDMENLYKNVKYVTSDNGTTTANFTVPDGDDPIYFKGTEQATFAAYGPYDDSSSSNELPGGNGVITSYTDDQDTRDKQKAFDYIYASGATGSLADPKVEFRFQHVMARLVIKVQASDESNIDFQHILDGEYYLGGLVHNGEFDVTTGKAKAYDSSYAYTDWELHNYSLRTVGDNYITFTSILYPQSISEVKFKAVIDGLAYNVTPFALNLEAGKTYTINITVKKAELDMTGSIIDAWVEYSGTGVDATM